MPHRVIGIGNDLRGDDAAGLMVARHLLDLGRPGLAVQQNSGDVGSLVEALRAGGEVDLVDAVSGPEPAGTVLRLDSDQAGRLRAATSTHGFGLTHAIALAAALGPLPEIRIHGVVGRRFGVGDPVSASVVSAARRLAVELAAAGDHCGGLDSCA